MERLDQIEISVRHKQEREPSTINKSQKLSAKKLMERCQTSSVTMKMQTQTTVKVHFVLMGQMSIMNEYTSVLMRSGATGTLTHCK